jgi:hypothetical protein
MNRVGRAKIFAACVERIALLPFLQVIHRASTIGKAKD